MPWLEHDMLWLVVLKKTPVFVFISDQLSGDHLQCVDVAVAQALVRSNALASPLHKYWQP